MRPISSNFHMQTLENGSLAIKELRQSDAGLYQCEAGNSVGAELSKRVRLRVRVRAHFRSAFEVTRVRLGRSLQVECRAFGEQPLQVRWMRERMELSPNDRRYERSLLMTDDGAIARLAIASVTRKDSATFTCVASNAFGQAELAQRVLVEEAPDPPTNVQLIERSHTSATVRFAVPYNGNSPIRTYVAEWIAQSDLKGERNWTDAKTARFEGGVQQVTIAPLIPLSTYHVRLIAENVFGRSETSSLLTITTDEQGKSMQTSDKQMKY